MCEVWMLMGRNVDMWIWWFGPAIGGMLQAVTYNLAPPYHAERVGKKAKGREKIRGNLALSEA